MTNRTQPDVNWPTSLLPVRAETLQEWLDGYRQRRRAGYNTDSEFENHMRVLFRASGYVKFRRWQREDLDAALEAVRGKPVPEPEPPRPREDQAPQRATDTARPIVARPQPDFPPRTSRAIGAASRSAKTKYCTEPGCRRRLPEYRRRAGLCPHHQQIHRRATWRDYRRRQRKSA